MALVGNMLAIALENPRQAGAVPPTQIMFFDVSDPVSPVFRSQFTPISGSGEPGPVAGVVAVTPLPGGRYLMMTTGGERNTTWYFYRSTLTDLSAPICPGISSAMCPARLTSPIERTTIRR